MDKYIVTGMSCAACSKRVEDAVKKVPGVKSCFVNLLTNSMNVEGDASRDEIIKAVVDAGYGIKNDNKSEKEEEFSQEYEIKTLKNRLFYSLVYLVILMYISMGHTMLNFWLPEFLDNNIVGQGILQMVLAIIVIVINKKFFVNGFKSAIKGAPNMDTLVALGSGASFIYSFCTLLLMSGSTNDDIISKHLHGFYFESSAMILTLITVGKLLEAISKGKTTNAIKSLMKLSPKTAIIKRDDKEEVVLAQEVKVGDLFIVKQGMSVCVDGVVVEGHCAIDESMLTGESIPVDKQEGDDVSCATINKSGYIVCRAKRIGEDTTFSKIIKMVSDASNTKAPIARIADKVSGVFVPVVLIISLITLIVWLILGKDLGFSLSRAISVLVISCPCALGLATPVAIMVGNGVGAKNGVLFKNAVALEQAGKAKIVVLDKTGTITKGEPKVCDIITYNNTTKEELLKYAYSLEVKSEHPIAFAIVKKAKKENIENIDCSDFLQVAGNGLYAKILNSDVYGGNLKFISNKVNVSQDIKDKSKEFSKSGKTPIYFCRDDTLLGVILISDSIKKDSKKAIEKLKKMGIKVVMLTGDNKETAKAVGDIVKVDEVISEVLPQEKADVIKKLKTKGTTIMVGDGVNDAPALVLSDVSMAVGKGTDIAMESADIVLMNSKLMEVPLAIKLSKKTIKNIRENLFWAFIYNIIGIPLAAGVWIPIFNWELNPMFGALAMSLSSFCVVTNALRLNMFKFDEENEKIEIKEKKTMEIKMNIEGMMCVHCEGRVKSTLEKIDGVSEAIVSHEKNDAIVKLSGDVSFETLKKAVEEQGYKVN